MHDPAPCWPSCQDGEHEPLASNPGDETPDRCSSGENAPALLAECSAGTISHPPLRVPERDASPEEVERWHATVLAAVHHTRAHAPHNGADSLADARQIDDAQAPIPDAWDK